MSGWRFIAILYILLLAIGACTHKISDIDDKSFASVSDVLSQGQKVASLCLHDASHVLPEHSGNCVAVARFLNKHPSLGDCHEDLEAHPKCKALSDRLHSILDVYWRAIAISLARAHDVAGYEFYFDGKAMSRQLADCIQNKKAAKTSCVSEGSDIWPKSI